MPQTFTRTLARTTSIATLQLADGRTLRGVIGGAQRETFSLGYAEPGEVVPTRVRLRYDEVVKVIALVPRTSVHLPHFARLMSGLR